MTNEQNPSRKKRVINRIQEVEILGQNKLSNQDAKWWERGNFPKDAYKFRKDYFQYITEIRIIHTNLQNFLAHGPDGKDGENYQTSFSKQFDKLISEIGLDEYINVNNTKIDRVRVFHNILYRDYKNPLPEYVKHLSSNGLSLIVFLMYFNIEDFKDVKLKIDKAKISIPINIKILRFFNSWKLALLYSFPLLRKWISDIYITSEAFKFDPVNHIGGDSNHFFDSSIDSFEHFNSIIPINKDVAGYVLTLKYPPFIHLQNLRNLENLNIYKTAHKIYQNAVSSLDKELRSLSPKKYLIDEYKEMIESFNGLELTTADLEDSENLSSEHFDLLRQYISSFKSGYKENELSWGKKIIEYDDGSCWVNMQKASCDFEAMAMNHCGNSPRSRSKDILYSFRKKLRDGTWKVSLTVTVNNGFIIEFKAYGNSKPSEKFHPFIVDFLLNKKANVQNASGSIGYLSEENFQFDDLSDEYKKIVLKAKPHITDEMYFIKNFMRKGNANLAKNNFWPITINDEDENTYFRDFTNKIELIDFVLDKLIDLDNNCHLCTLWDVDKRHYDEIDVVDILEVLREFKKDKHFNNLSISLKDKINTILLSSSFENNYNLKAILKLSVIEGFNQGFKESRSIPVFNIIKQHINIESSELYDLHIIKNPKDHSEIYRLTFDTNVFLEKYLDMGDFQPDGVISLGIREFVLDFDISELRQIKDGENFSYQGFLKDFFHRIKNSED